MTDQAEPADSPEPLQFDAVEPSGGTAPAAGAPVCAQCKRPIEEQYYEVERHIICGRCKDLLSAQFGGSGGGRMARAVLYGLGAAAAGAALYYGVREATGLEIGIIAIAVGWLVGRAVQRGGGGRGGWKYQTLAVGLTYFAIASTYVPVLIKEIAHTGAKSESRAGVNPPVAPAAPTDSLAATEASPVDSAAAGAPASKKPTTFLGFLGAVLILFGVVISLPIIANVMDPPSGLLGLLIIFIGLLQAWRMNKRVDLIFNGPFQVGGGSQPGVSRA